jgi:hypothetical protein
VGRNTLTYGPLYFTFSRTTAVVISSLFFAAMIALLSKKEATLKHRKEL